MGSCRRGKQGQSSGSVSCDGGEVQAHGSFSKGTGWVEVHATRRLPSWRCGVYPVRDRSHQLANDVRNGMFAKASRTSTGFSGRARA